MAGQASWDAPGSSTKAYVVNPVITKGLWYESTYRTMFSKLNGPREVKEVEIMHQGQKMVVDSGNNSVVWEKEFNGVGECRFTMREETIGMATYGDADPKPGKFAQYRHSECYVITTDSPVQPIVGFESAQNIKDVVEDLVKVEKDNLSMWMSKEIDADGFRALVMGGSRGILGTTDGGKGITLPGCTAGQQRSCYNTYVQGQTGLTTPSYTQATHEATLSTLLAALTDVTTQAFDLDMHKAVSYFISRLNFTPASIGGVEYRAVCFADERNIERLTAVGGTLATLFQFAMERGKKNPAIYSMNTLVIDDILYIPCRQLEALRPTADGSTVAYGAALSSDPRTYSNTSPICMNVYMGAGALLRGRRKNTSFTVDEGDHGKGASYCLHYHDGWKRNEWSTKDGRSEIKNMSSLVTYNRDPGVGIAYAA